GGVPGGDHGRHIRFLASFSVAGVPCRGTCGGSVSPKLGTGRKGCGLPGSGRGDRTRPAFLVAVDPGTVLCCVRSQEHTSEIQSRFDLVCRLLLEKKKENFLVQAGHYAYLELYT